MRLVDVMQLPAGPAQLKRFKDPVFRISNLYSIRTREGKVIPFRPRPQQLQVLDMLYRQKLKRVCILKARQLGFDETYNVNVGLEIRTPNKKNDEDQSEATDWIIFDFSEDEAMARRSA